MEWWIIAALAAANFFSVYLWVSEFVKRQKAESLIQNAEAGMKGARSAADRFEKLFTQYEKKVRELQDLAIEDAYEHTKMLDSVRQQEVRRAQAEQTRLLSQIQAMADRMATMKIKYTEGNEGKTTLEEDQVAFDATIHEPSYSPGLTDFLASLETDDAKEMVEDYIIARRDEGMIDAQILEKLERGDY